MKKKIMLVSTMVVMAMSAMFVACNQNTPATQEDTMKNGCICTLTDKDGNSEMIRATFEEMVDQYQVTTCPQMANVVRDYVSANTTVSCKGY